MEQLLEAMLDQRSYLRRKIKANLESDPRFSEGAIEGLVSLNLLLSVASQSGLVPAGMQIWDEQY